MVLWKSFCDWMAFDELDEGRNLSTTLRQRRLGFTEQAVAS